VLSIRGVCGSAFVARRGNHLDRVDFRVQEVLAPNINMRRPADISELVTVRGNRGPNRLLTDGKLFQRTVSQRNFVEFEIITESRSRKDQPLVIRATSVGELTIQIAQQRKRGASAEWILRTLFVLCRVQNYLAGGDEAALRHLVFVTM